MRKINQLTRLLRLFVVLGTADERGLPTARLLQRLGCGHSTLYRDLRFLRSCGLAISVSHQLGEARYRLQDEAIAGWLLPLHVGNGADLLGRLDAWLTRFAPAAAAQLPTAAARSERAAASLPVGLVAAVQSALAAKQRLRLHYPDHSGTLAWRDVDPAALREHAGQLYLVATDVAKRAPRRFKLARALAAEPTGLPATLAGQANDDDATSIGIWSAPPVAVRLWVAAEALRLVREHPLPGQVVVPAADGSAELTAVVAGDVEIRAWVLSYGPAVRVIEPAFLRGAVAEQLRRAAAAYAGQGE